MGQAAVERAPEGMRRFVMKRRNDASGVSGTGLVLEGVLFSTGVVVIHWLTPPPRGSISVFDSFSQFLGIHVTPHPDNQAVIEFEDGELIIGPDVEVSADRPAASVDPDVTEAGDRQVS